MRNLQVPAIHPLRQFKLESPEHRRQSHINLRLRDVLSNAHPRAPRVRHQICLSFLALCAEESCWIEHFGRWENGRVVVLTQNGHGDGRSWRDGVVAIADWSVARDACEAVDHAVGVAVAFGDEGGLGRGVFRGR